MASRVCRCGGIRDPRGLCLHCDFPRTCEARCLACHLLRLTCYVCRHRCVTPAAAQACEARCRNAEIIQERGRAA